MTEREEPLWKGDILNYVERHGLDDYIRVYIQARGLEMDNNFKREVIQAKRRYEDEQSRRRD